MYDISVKDSNGFEVFRGQNFTEELTKLAFEKYATYPVVHIFQSPYPEQEKKECNNAIENLTINISRDQWAKNCADFLKGYCDSKNCTTCQFYNHTESICRCRDTLPCAWTLKEGD